MKSVSLMIAPLIFLLLLRVPAYSSGPRAGFYLPDSVNEMTLKYRTVKGLIVLPVTINDSVKVNLILDTGCRNLILFGKKFRKLFAIHSPRPVEFSGLGAGTPVVGSLSLNNKVSIEQVLGERIPVVIVNDANLFSQYAHVDGVVGYEIFLKFEIALNAREQSITFRPAMKSRIPCGYTKVPLKVVDARPVMESEVTLNGGNSFALELMIDTGSGLGLLVKTTNFASFGFSHNARVLGVGLNGAISGYLVSADKLVMHDLEMESVPTSIVSSPWHNNASIGMTVLRDYIVVVNYCLGYACFKRNV